jgi:hypothetical protein
MISGNNLIDNIEMVSLTGQTKACTEQLEAISRVGVSGHIIARTGNRGDPFKLVSVRDYLTTHHAQLAMRLYRTYKGQDPVVIKWHGLDLHAYSKCKFAVLNVEPLNLQAVPIVVGGISADNKAILIAEWEVLPIFDPSAPADPEAPEEE